MKKGFLKIGKSLLLSFSLLALAFVPVAAQTDEKIKVSTFTQSAGDKVPTSSTVLITNIVNTVLIVAAALVFAYLIYGAISWITSGGDKSKVETARNRITSAALGILILASVWAIYNLVLTIAFGGQDLQIKNLNEGVANRINQGTRKDETDKREKERAI